MNDLDELNGFEVRDEGNNADALALEQVMFKLRKKLDKDLVDELENMNESELRARIAQSDCNIHESEKARAADQELHSLQEKLKIMRSSYADVKKTQSMIIKYCTCLLDAAGKI